MICMFLNAVWSGPGYIQAVHDQMTARKTLGGYMHPVHPSPGPQSSGANEARKSLPPRRMPRARRDGVGKPS